MNYLSPQPERVTAGYTSFIVTNSEREMSLSWMETCVCITQIAPLGMMLYNFAVLSVSECVCVCVSVRLRMSTTV